MNTGRLLPVMLALLAGMLIWLAVFTAAYTAAAVVCARGLAGSAVFGIPILPFMLILTTLVGLVLTGAVGLGAYRKHAARSDAEAGALPRFATSMTLLTAFLAVVAIIWNGLPALFFHGCT